MTQQNLRQEKTDARRQQILQAALECFSEAGFHATTMPEIRQRSGASTGSIYHHFKSKENIAAELYLEGLRIYQHGLSAELDSHKDASSGIQGMVHFHLGWVEEHPAWSQYLFQMRRSTFVAEREADIASLNQQFLQRIGHWFGTHIQSGAIRKLPMDLYGSVIIGPCQELAREWLAGKVSTPMAQARAVLAEAAWRALEPRAK
jgi:AcrR family transcriptional regulator